MTDKQLIEVEVNHTPAVVDFDYETLKSKLESTVSEYNIVVTPETVKDAKKVAADINKLKADINDRLVSVAKEMEVKPKELRAKAKELAAICDDGRAKITEQVDRFEQKQKDKARELLETHLAVCIAEHSVSPQFQTASIDDLVKLGSLNSKGDSLTKKAKDDVENRVAKDASAEQKVKLRHSELENKSNRAGLASPLTPEHVAPFIDAPDDEYNERLQAILDREVEREKAAKERHERELKEQHERELAEQQRTFEKQQAEAEKKPEPEPEHKRVFSDEQSERLDKTFEKVSEERKTEAGQKVVRVTVEFDVTVPDHVPAKAVADKVGAKLKDAEFEWVSCYA